MAETRGVDHPEITLDMRASARSNPNSWLYVIDPGFAPGVEVPPWGVVGAYPVDADGEIVERFRANAEYRPSPVALRLPMTSNPLERLIQLVHTRHRDQRELVPAVLGTPLLVYACGRDDQRVTAFPDRGGRLVVPACTSAAHVPAEWPGVREVAGAELAAGLGGLPLVVNPLGPLTAVFPAKDLRGLVASR
ncbi:type VII secretion system-associated protein [Actinokineospora pegani]|uniref:type VII secretion system-associated protein n=1 Tax=Actinokineospora pegani TaxID=2654637 RepID=UPI001F17AD79|nr:type VII secretion system-associated protein [Actinokineospora pegani]